MVSAEEFRRRVNARSGICIACYKWSKVAADHQAHLCPICGAEKLFDLNTLLSRGYINLLD
jgi:rRNA maturation endonuclease Nob1